MISKHNIGQVLDSYDFKPSFLNANIGVPIIDSRMKSPFFGTLETFLHLYSNIILNNKMKIVFYMEGSKGFSKGKTYREWVVLEQNAIFFAPNSFAIKGRPVYDSLSTIDEYERVHLFRQAEIYYNLKEILHLNLFNENKLYLMGNSEGALAAGIYSGSEFQARILLAWNCENGYYTQNATLGASTDTPILNVIGLEDEYFGKNSSLNINYNIDGNCHKALQNYTIAKIILLPQIKHNLLDSPYLKDEILSFIDKW